MAKIDRHTGNLEPFAINAQIDERKVFGGTTESDTLDDNLTALMKEGWADVVNPTIHPKLRDFNAAMFTAQQLSAYLFQRGIAEYHDQQTYYIGSLCTNVVGDIYISQTDDNTGELLTDVSKWKRSSTPLNPTGLIITMATTTVPVGYLECNGSLISRTTYSDLFAIIGIVHGDGDGSTTFNIPDLRGEFVRGWDHGRGIDVGRVFGSNQLDAFKEHSHLIEHGLGSQGTGGTWANSTYQNLSPPTSGYATGGNETRPRNIALMYCIKY